MMTHALITLTVATLLRPLTPAEGHGRLIEPPSRASMWRYGFDTPPDYNDHEQYCGGFSRHWGRNGGKCGICGDPWDAPTPRAHEAGGMYARGVLVRKYRKATAITIRVEVTANHRGYFEFRLCANDNPRKAATQACLDTHILKKMRTSSLEGGDHPTRYYPGPDNRVFEFRYTLPEGLTCSQCVLQWRYVAGNSWGRCTNGTEGLGCGAQEEFRACADVAVYSDKKKEETSTTERTQAEDHNGIVSLFAIVLCSCIGVLATVYCYYYHAASTIKECLAGVGHHKVPSVAEGLQELPQVPPRAKRASADVEAQHSER